MTDSDHSITTGSQPKKVSMKDIEIRDDLIDCDLSMGEAQSVELDSNQATRLIIKRNHECKDIKLFPTYPQL